MNDLESRVFDRLPDSPWFYGDGKDSTLETERPHLAEWRARGWRLRPNDHRLLGHVTTTPASR
jgi:hypothetical protein